MTEKCPRKCGRILRPGQRMCDSCRSKLSSHQRSRLDSGQDISTIIATITSSDSSYSGSGGDGGGGGGCGGGE